MKTAGASGLDRKIIRVSCAVITENGKLLTARRSGKMDQPMKWELPGGKIEEGEALFDSITRELREELGIETEPAEKLESVVHHYPEKSIELIPVRVKILSGVPAALDHHEIRWILPREAEALDWADADRRLLEKNSMLRIRGCEYV